MTIGGIVVGVLLAGFLLFSFLGGGEEAAPPQVAPPLTPGAGSPSPSPGGGGPPIQSFTGRDPFSVPPGLAPSPSPSAPGGSESPSPTDGGGGGSQTQTPSPTVPGGGSSQNVGGSTVVLLDIFRRDGASHAQVEVDGTVHDVVVGEQFANGRYELRSVSGNCATFLFGDEQFALCIDAQK